ncbi:MAG TPA: TraR/DksA C4-type zinc finger protein [Actinomycetota bacterium]|nr:TraR/DksA C4-type zinc finger protein [Actinomycetota bacterium]
MDTAEISRRLEAERRRLAELTGTLSVPNGASKAEVASEQGDYDQHPADMASETFERAKDLSILIGMAAKIADIDRALERLAAGSYGICEACGQPIAEARLEAWPAARFCRADQARSERSLLKPAAPPSQRP